MGKTHSEETRNKISNTRKETRLRRSKMRLTVFDLKLVSNHMSKAQKEALRSNFLQYKWIRNYAVSQGRFDAGLLNELNGVVPVMLPNGEFEDREISALGTHLKQDVFTQLKSNLKSLSKLKKNGRKVGSLKFVSEVNSIGLKAHGQTYNFKQNGRGDYTRVSIQKLPGTFRLRGYEQLRTPGAEFANANLCRKADGYHLMVTVYLPKEDEAEAPSSEIGIDFGVKTAYTLSDGTEFDPQFEESETLKRLQSKLSRQIKGSNGYEKTRKRIAREHLKSNNQKDEWSNQFVHRVVSGNHVFFQDEALSSWRRKDSQARGSRKIQYGTMGRVKERLKRSPHTTMLPRWTATTAWCNRCGTKTPHQLEKRIFHCKNCDYTQKRDVHAAENMVILGKKAILIASGTEVCDGGGAVRLNGTQKQKLYSVESDGEHALWKPEAAKSSVSP